MVPGWTDEQTRYWLYNGTAAAGLVRLTVASNPAGKVDTRGPVHMGGVHPGRGEVKAPVHAGGYSWLKFRTLHIPDRILNYLFRDAWSHNHHDCLRGALGHGATASSLRAATYQTIAGGERTLII